MSKQAYDPTTNSIVSATNFLTRDEYHCIHPDCNAILHICKGDNPHFSANPKTPHIDTCPFRADSSYDPKTEVPDEFEINEFLEDLISRPYIERGRLGTVGGNTIKKNNPNGNIEIYVNSIASFSNYCRYHDMDTIFDGIHKISDYCVDGRNVDKLWAEFEGTRLLIGNIKYFSLSENLFRLKISSKINTKLYANIEVKVNPTIVSDLFNKIRNRHNSVNDAPVAILCECKFVGKKNCNGYEYKNLVETFLNSLNQIQIL